MNLSVRWFVITIIQETKMGKNTFRFSIFLPVKNGGSYLPLCVESILAQSIQDFDLVILENQSTDGTAEWLQSLEGKDSRVKVITSDLPLSMEDNWKRILSIRKNELMTIVGHDDLLDQDFLEEIYLSILEEPTASLYLTHYRLIDSNGKFIRYCSPNPKQESAAEFLAARMAGIRDSFGTGYVMRSKQYDEIGGFPNYPNLMYADDALWLKIMGTNFKKTSPRVCFSYRVHSRSVSGAPNQDALFFGLKEYLAFLKQLALRDADVARMMKLYGPQYVAKRCQGYCYHLFKMATWGQRVDQKKMLEIENLMSEFASETVLDKTYANYLRLKIKYGLTALTNML